MSHHAQPAEPRPGHLLEHEHIDTIDNIDNIATTQEKTTWP